MKTVAAVALAIFLLLNATAHFVRATYVRRLVPPWLGRPDLAVRAGGIALVVDAILLLTPNGRALGGAVAAALISVFVVAHLDALARAVAERPRRPGRLAGGAAKVVLNLGYIGWAVAVSVTAH